MEDPKKEVSEVQSERGRIISNFAFLEMIISQFIANHYSSITKTKFIEEVLEDEFFSFELKKRLFRKILKNYFKEIENKFPNKEFSRMQTIRNIIAHGVIQANQDDIKNPKKALNVRFRHGGKDYPARELLNEYFDLKVIVQKAIEGLPNIKVRVVF